MPTGYFNWTKRVNFGAAAPGTVIPTAYAGTVQLIAADVMIGASGASFDFLTGPPAWQGAVWPSGAAVDQVRGTHPGVDQHASCLIGSTAIWQSPGMLVRGNGATGDGFGVNPFLHLGSYEIADYTGGVYTLLAVGGATVDQVGDKLTAVALKGAGGNDTIGGYLNEVVMVALVSALHPTGDPGIIGAGTDPGGNAGSDFRFGNMAKLTNLTIAESTGWPVVIDAGQLSGTFESDILEGSGSCPWWSVLCEVHEEEVGHLVGEADYAAGSGEARWRGVYTREATEARPGADFDLTVSGAAAINVEDESYRVCGRTGMHGRNTRAKVWTRFRVAGVWQPYVEGAWVGSRAAEAMQVKVELDRVTLDYELRMTRLLLAVAA